MERVLDAAADLLVRRGYRGVTVEDVARQAGVGKGTVYLHVRTKDALLLTVLLRAQWNLFSDLADRFVADPAMVLPWRMTRALYERLQADDVARALYLGDAEVLGRVAREAAGTLGDLATRRDAVVREHVELLRAAGLVADDLPVVEQIHGWGAVAYGFFATAGIRRAEEMSAPVDPDRHGELLEHALQRLLTGSGAAPDARIANAVAGLYRPLVEHVDTEWRRRVR